MLRYELDIGDPVNQKDCFCRNPGECPPKGTFDLYRCSGTPMLASHPHFYNGDPSLLANIESGMNPNKKDHAVFLLFELVRNVGLVIADCCEFILYFDLSQMTGTPVSAAKRLQFNLDVVPIPEIAWMKDMRQMVFPLFWIEEGAHLDRSFTNKLKNSLFL